MISFSPSHLLPACRTPADVAFALDASGSIGKVNFQKQLDFVRDVILGLNLEGGARVALETYANQPSVSFYLNDATDRAAVLNSLTMHYSGGTTNTADAIRVMREDIFTVATGDRPDVGNVGVVLTDGRSNDENRTWHEAMRARDGGIHLIAVGIGGNVRTRELDGIASFPTESNVLRADGFDGLAAIRESLVQAVCNGRQYRQLLECVAVL